jgi:hypothetical protein
METFGFHPTYSVELDPEFPGDGDWKRPVYGFDRSGTIVDPFRSPWGTPLLVAVEPGGGSPWVGMFQAGGLGGVTAAYSCPRHTDLCVVAEGQAYIVGVTNPAAGAMAAQNTVMQVEALATLLLLVRPWDIVAIGIDGVAWHTLRLVVDDLRIERADDRSIVCSGDTLGGTPTIEVDPRTGVQVGGTRLDFAS